jgi:hypothetical protein
MIRECRWVLGTLAVVLANVASAPAQEAEQKVSCASVPAQVRTAFEKMFPRAMIKACATELELGKKAFEISSREGKINRDVLFYPDATLIVVEESIDFDQLPEPVREAVQKAVPRQAIKLSEKVTRGETVYYEFHIRRGNKDEELAFDPMGKEVKL